jgi:phage terminase large subunit-like protein
MPRQVQIANSLPAGVEGVELPDGVTYTAGQHVTLTDEEWARVNPQMVTNGLLIDGGVVGDQSDQVQTQGSAVTLTSAQVTPATVTLQALATAYNALQADVAALNTQLSGAGRALA